jgi:hypothetical protein
MPVMFVESGEQMSNGIADDLKKFVAILEQ